MTVEALTEKYRPKTFSEVVGHEVVVRSLKQALDKGASKAFLFTGPSGVGKTTLAYIAAATVGAKTIIDIDGASKTGIDDMRQVADEMQYRPLDGDAKAIIIDEVHALSKQAIQSLLKILEKPPSWGFWFLCTTEPNRVPKTIQTRCAHYDLKPVQEDKILDYLELLANKEKLYDGPIGEEIIALCAVAAEGSVRQAVANFVVCGGAKTLKEAQGLLQTVQSSAEAVELARLLVRGAAWRDVQSLLNKLTEASPETVRHVVRAYVDKVVCGSKQPESGLAILEAFDKPFYTHACITLAVGKLTFQS